MSSIYVEYTRIFEVSLNSVLRLYLYHGGAENTKSLPEGQAKDEQIVEAEKTSSAENSTILTKTEENGKLNLGEKNSKPEKGNVDRRSSVDYENLSSSGRIKAYENSTMLEENQGTVFLACRIIYVHEF